MKEKLLILIFILIIYAYFTTAQNETICDFSHELQMINHSIDMFGKGDYYPNLVSNTPAYAEFRLWVWGNWTNLTRDIRPRIEINCGNDKRGTINSFDESDSFASSNGSVITEFIVEHEFFVRENSIYCQAAGEVNCRTPECPNCYITGLSGRVYGEGFEKEVRTKTEYAFMQQTKSLEEQTQLLKESLQDEKGNRNIERVITFISLVVGSFLAYFFNIWLEKRKTKNAQFIEDKKEIYRPLYDELNSVLKHERNGLLWGPQWREFINDSSGLRISLTDKNLTNDLDKLEGDIYCYHDKKHKAIEKLTSIIFGDSTERKIKHLIQGSRLSKSDKGAIIFNLTLTV
jgi:hypothetical protein